MADYGFAVKKPGITKNVEDCLTSELAASSKFNCFKIAYENKVTITASPSDPLLPSLFVNHALNFNPGVLAFCEINSGQWFSTSLGQGLSNYVRFLYYSEGNSSIGRDVAIWIVINSGSSYTSSHNFQVKYFIFGDTVDELTTTSTVPNPDDYGIKVMKSGYDASTDNYIEHINWSSSVPPMKVAKIATISESVPATATTSFTISHNLGYAPAFMIFRELSPGSGQYAPMPFGNLKSSTDIGSAEAYVTDSNLVITERNIGAAKTINYRYILFAEKLN